MLQQEQQHQHQKQQVLLRQMPQVFVRLPAE